MFKIRKEYINTFNEGYTLEINIIDYCNLNCAGCDHFAHVGMGKYIEPEDLLSQLNTIVKQLPNIKKVILLGGEPLLHPKLYEMCTKIRNCYPSIQINIITNGILLNKWSIEDYIKYQNINVGFGITKYPDIDYSTIPPLNNIGYLSTRFLFQDTKIDIYGEQKKEHFYNCSRDNSIGLTLNNGKLYFCPFSACLKNFTNKFNIIIEEVEGIDYLDINDLNIDKILQFCQTPKNICKYCKERQQAFFWHKIENNNIFLEYTQNKQSLYLTNYKDYYRKYNDISLYQKLKNNGMWENVDPIYCANILDRILHRIERTKIDIIIPYYKVNNNLIKTLHKTLSEQNFIDNCTIYFVSDESPQERQVYEEFENSFLNCVFLKTEKRSGPGIARNLAIEESFGEYKFFLDFDDSFGDKNTLKFLYDKVLENNYPDIITAKMNDEYWENGQQNRPVLIKSSFLKTKNIRYGELFLNEDAFFSANLFINTDNIVKTDYPAYTYNRRNSLHIPSIFKYGQKEIVIAEIVFDVYLYLHLQDSELLFNGIKFFRHINKLDLSSLSSQIEKNEVFQFYKVCYNKIKKIDKYNLFNENYTLLKEDYNQFNNILEKNIIPEKFKKQLLNL